ncbi:ABC transporter permease [Nocardioides sp. NPDC126508]
MRTALGRLATGLAASTVEAWQELRIHKLRVLLSLVGVAVAVASITATVAAGQIAKQMFTESYETDGRPAHISIMAYDGRSGMPLSVERVRPAFQTVAERFDVTYASARISVYDIKATTASRSKRIELMGVDPAYAAIHRVVVPQGRWLEASDQERLSPALVVDETFLKKLGLQGAPLPTSVDLKGQGMSVTATIVGVTSLRGYGTPRAFMLADSLEHWQSGAPTDAAYEMWVPVDGADELAGEINTAMRAELPGLQVDAQRDDYMAWGGEDPIGPVKWVIIGIAGIILLLGALSLLNIALVTIQQRIREIGIRRSFGATTGRVFFSVLMESVVATVVAGVIGVLLAVAAVKNPLVEKYVLQGIDDVPPFPLSAAFLGLAVALAVGAVAGILPAMIAARVKIIDAIRF